MPSPLVLPISLHEETLLEDSLNVVKILRPKWDISKVKSKVFTGGLSNKLTGFYEEGRKNEMVLVRIYGQNMEFMIDRKYENEIMQLLHEYKCGPELYAILNNGICFEFIPGDTLTVERCHDPAIYPLIAKEMAKMHSTIPIKNQNGYSKPRTLVWQKTYAFNELLKQFFQAPENKHLLPKFSGIGFDISKGFDKQIEELKGILEAENMPVTFSHNDLLPGNIMYNKENSSVCFIDVEWSFPNYAPVDVANHFIEFAGTDNPDFSKCPDASFRSKWIAEYMKHCKIPNSTFSQATFERWVEMCTPLPHLMWTIVAAMQAPSTTIDFDYFEFAASRYSEYLRQMEDIRKYYKSSI